MWRHSQSGIVWVINCDLIIRALLVTYGEYEGIVQGEQADAIELKVSFPVKELQREWLHFVVEQIVAEHEGWFLLHYLVYNHGWFLGVVIGVAAQSQDDIGHYHGGEAPNDEQIGNIVQQPALAAHYEVDLGFQENTKNAHHEAGRHVGYTLWSEFPISYHAEREDFVVQHKQVRQIGLRSASSWMEWVFFKCLVTNKLILKY